MVIIEKPEDLRVDLITTREGSFVRLTSGNTMRDLSIPLATYLASELASAVILTTENNAPHHPANRQGPGTPAAPAAAGNILSWHRRSTGHYYTEANNLRLEVFNDGKSTWFAKAGNTLINPDMPLTTKQAAQRLAEDTLMS
jgi:hypothetical protein